MKIAVIGLGNMGQPIARNVLQAGYELTVYNRTKQKTEDLVTEGAQAADTPRLAAKSADIVITMLADDDSVSTVTFGEDGLLEGLAENGIHISMSTISVEFSEKLAAAHAEKGQSFLAAPVLGRPDAAAKAALRIITAGPAEAKQTAKPLLDSLSQQVFDVGEESKIANAAKISINFLLVSMLEALSESFLMMEKYGLEQKQFLEIASALFGSPVYQNYGTIMAEQKFEPAGFKMSLGLKDTNLALAAAKRVSANLPLAELAKSHFENGIEKGFGDLDWAALIKCIK
ncbi:3-hydroxyisobutyrate dehydrogenase [Bacillus subtilis]|uniref:NAD(P)-dependent oxidoreductase n=1 Tax=Bacillus subtilis TaxID=1423 RepID=UPI001CE2A246|nr:NAD(P)-dependent oxidoreductase [Bacillus subtilis]MEC2334910.1 NAD(P)-dependent oxidoreductase [Bacillus subtilis]UBZ17766.1 3-hydroxyisobutyrate dehydrogenase [Bacillus subtilis]UYP04189.1 NAD(P)-dependent oxidoreductase [Bacillus subtilis]WAE49214.1 NAD(P)-dependent oxidoreductase [Bacillus subtilis]